MTTKALLEQAVEIGGVVVKPIITEIDAYVSSLWAIPADRWTRKEAELMEVAFTLETESLPVIDIGVAIKAGGAHTNGLPRLAIASLYASLRGGRVEVEVRPNGSVHFSSPLDEYYAFFNVDLEADTLPKGFLFSRRGETAVPLTPPELRPEYSPKIALLFEVDKWDAIIRPVDPYVLRRVAGNVYQILGSWNISKLELEAQQKSRKLGI
jgi:hypothetical protein